MNIRQQLEEIRILIARKQITEETKVQHVVTIDLLLMKLSEIKNPSKGQKALVTMCHNLIANLDRGIKSKIEEVKPPKKEEPSFDLSLLTMLAATYTLDRRMPRMKGF